MDSQCREIARISKVFFGIEPDHQMPIVELLFVADGWGQSLQMCVSTIEQVVSAKKALVETLLPEKDQDHGLVGVVCYVLRSLPYGDIVGVESFTGKRFLRAAWWRQVADPGNPTEAELYMRTHQARVRQKWQEYLRAIDDSKLPDGFIDWEKYNG